jgi:chromosome segregation ATPase
MCLFCFQVALARANDKLDASRRMDDWKLQVLACVQRLDSVADNGEQTLADSDATPLSYQQLSDVCNQELTDAHQLLHQIDQIPDLSVRLQSSIDRVEPIAHRLADRWSIWQQFVVARDNANVQLDTLRKPLIAVEQKPLRSLADAIVDLDALKIALAELEAVLKPTMHELHHLSEQLDPLESPYSDVRFFDVDVEQTQQQFEETMTSLSNEIANEQNFMQSVTELFKYMKEMETSIDETSYQSIAEQMAPIERQIAIFADNDDRKYVQHNDDINASVLQNQFDHLRNMLDETEKSANHAIELRMREDTVSRLVNAIDQLEQAQRRSDGHDESSLNGIEQQLAPLQTQIENLADDDERKVILRNRLSALNDWLNAYRIRAAQLAEWLRRMRERAAEIDEKSRLAIPVDMDDDERLNREINLLEDVLRDIESEPFDQLKLQYDEFQPNNVEVSQLVQHMDQLKQGYEEKVEQKKNEKNNREKLKNDLANLNDRLVHVDELIGQVDAQLKSDRNADTSSLDNANMKIDDVTSRLLPDIFEQIEQTDKVHGAEIKKRCDVLQATATTLGKLLASLGRWMQEKAIIESVIDDDSINTILNKYQNGAPQSFGIANEDVNTLNHIRERINKLSPDKLIQLANELKSSSIDWPADETDKLIGRYQSTLEQLRDLDNCLRADIEVERQLLDEFNSTMAQLNQLADRVVTVSGDTEQALAQMTAMQQDLVPFEQRIAVLKAKSSQVPNLVLHADAVHLPTLESQYGNISTLVNNSKQDMAMCLSIVAVTSAIAKEDSIIRENINTASNMVAADDTTTDQLSSAIELLETVAVPHLNALNDAYEKIPIDASTDELRSKTLDDRCKLDETVKSLLMSLRDRLDNLKQFNEKMANIIDRIASIEKQSRDHERIADPNERLYLLDGDLQQLKQLSGDVDQLMVEGEYLSPSMRKHLDHTIAVIQDMRNRLQVQFQK